MGVEGRWKNKKGRGGRGGGGDPCSWFLLRRALFDVVGAREEAPDTLIHQLKE